MQYPYLISRLVDPVAALFIGSAAYFLQEKRLGREEGHTFIELAMKRWRGEP
ncbi:hypothetical protein PUMCH_002185 [Australozyma saopauloensis]|uniref:Non-classical export protein 1 n=1 Tax=Australozyma saopauloensis TaxID=291208 RepID=A0AAX4H8N5_9ASCO|nr:hypothetical protein PUMCH_002185 [[Candida] saopauloensis]